MKYNIYYKGERIHENLSPEECSEAFQDLATQYYEGEKTDFSEIYLEEIVDG